MSQAEIGLIGLAVMGQNLALNIDDHGFKIAVYNRTPARTEAFMQGPGKNTAIVDTYSIAEFAASLTIPRKIILMVRAGDPVDHFIDQLLPHLEASDIILDGGNSRFIDSNRRYGELADKEIRFIGCGISGGKEGARNGPSIMPGGDQAAWPEVKPILQSIAAKVDGEPCCQWIGEAGAGHYVKMVHNGIEYGDMQLICEAYQLMREGLGLPASEIQAVFTEWNQGVLDSYLIKITANILGMKDDNGAPLIDKILDTAGQKGTGKWAGISALDLGVPLTLIGEAVFARCLSSIKQERVQAETLYGRTDKLFIGNKKAAIQQIHDALYASKIISYAQGYMLMREAAEEYGWNLSYGDIALMWRGGCIIRSRFLGNIKTAFSNNPELKNLLLDDFFIQAIKAAEPGWRKATVLGIEQGIPLPAFSSALSFYDGYRNSRLPANLLQAQRDYFGAHTYERINQPKGTFFHTDWTGTGGAAASSTYDV
ncbi:decarboxylating NADP(+)-dependent phosphogluconate dehydrogenase [Candidatus Vondammii sp. HM_W22]|uniref:decarboxylating NADP(+)-dependent phosphogluconate dehydrogenase n=1 Tax=Candidatus Vondammii sp. HM_W22 TaxID=2687299 RepID=UPI001F142F1F|nr:decarboxylating NADP(+)-dependent phosphogluconate dehydrogenase [Candidatus Vondammii sp. HM_W22]